MLNQIAHLHIGENTHIYMWYSEDRKSWSFDLVNKGHVIARDDNHIDGLSCIRRCKEVLDYYEPAQELITFA